jgi:hypothetical protein
MNHRHRPRKWAPAALAFKPGEIIRYDNGTVYEVQADGSYARRLDYEMQLRTGQVQGHPTVQKPKVGFLA